MDKLDQEKEWKKQQWEVQASIKKNQLRSQEKAVAVERIFAIMMVFKQYENSRPLQISNLIDYLFSI